MSRGFLVNADPSRGTNSGVVMGRIGQSRRLIGRSGGQELPNVRESDVVHQLQNFIQINNLDESCQRHLGDLSPSQQAAVMEQGLVIAVDPSRGSANSVVMGRIKKVKQAGGGPPPPSTGTLGMPARG